MIPSYLAMKTYDSCDFVASNMRFHTSIEFNLWICDNIAIRDYTVLTPWEIGRGKSNLRQYFSNVVSNMTLLLKYTHMKPRLTGIYSHVLECVIMLWNNVPTPFDEAAPDSMYNGLYHPFFASKSINDQCVSDTFTLLCTCTIWWFGHLDEIHEDIEQAS